MRYGLIGEKLGHSFSKTIHERLCAYSYDLIPLRREELDGFLTKKDFSAINVTIPYKEAVLPYLAYLDPAAQKIGAVNTIVNRGGELYGYNTDFAGMEYMLDAHHFDLSGKKVLILGSGGTSKTARAVAEHRAARDILIVSRRPCGGQISYEEAYARHADADILLNTTPAGMYPAPDGSPLDLSRFNRLSCVIDVIYNPLRTCLLQQAHALGVPCCNGLSMLVAQAKYAAEHFTGQALPDARIEEIHRDLCLELSNIALIGMPSCGKSTIGRLLAEKTGKRFVDVDQRIAQAAGMSIPELFSRHGEAYFRRLEKEVLRELSGQTHQVLATGGGIVKDEDNIRLLRHNSLLCFIDRDLSQLRSNDPSRPLSTSWEAVCELYRQRLPLYRQYADVTVDNSGTIAEAAERIKEKFYEIAGH